MSDEVDLRELDKLTVNPALVKIASKKSRCPVCGYEVLGHTMMIHVAWGTPNVPAAWCEETKNRCLSCYHHALFESVKDKVPTMEPIE